MKRILVFVITAVGAVAQTVTPGGGSGGDGGGTIGGSVAATVGIAVCGNGTLNQITSVGCTTGLGSVTNFTSGNAAPLFTTSVANSTSTPAQTFTLSSAAQNSILAGPPSGGAGAPSYQLGPTFNGANITGLPPGGISAIGNASVLGNVSGGSATPAAVSLPTTANALWKSIGANGQPAASSLVDNATTVSTTLPFSAGSISTGTSPPAITFGSGGAQGFSCGTAPSAGPATGVYVSYCDGTFVGRLVNRNNLGFLPEVLGPVSVSGSNIPQWTSEGILGAGFALGSNIQTFLTTPSAANFNSAMTGPVQVATGGTGLTGGTAGKVFGGATPSMVTVTSAYVDNSIALTGTDINTSNQVTVTHLASALPVGQGGTGITALGTGVAGALGTNVSGSGAICLAVASACASGSGTTGTSVTNTTPVTANANSTAEQFLMELSLGAGYLNSSGQPFLINGAFVYTTPAAQTPTITITARLCTVSGCGSGTNRVLASIVSTATLASVTNNTINLNLVSMTHATGATGTLEVHGPLSIDLGALTTTADSVFNDINTAVTGTIDLTAALFIDFSVTFSTNAIGANSITQRQGGIMPWAATAAPVTSVFTQTGAVGNLTGDVTTTNSTATTIAAGAVTNTKIGANAVGSSKLAVVNTYRTCDIPINDTSGSAITSGQMGPQSRVCFIPAASTIVEMDVNADAGTPNIIIGRNRAGTIVNIVSGALATAASGGIACSNTGGTTGLNGATTCSSTLQNTGLNAGDYLELVSGTPGGTAKFFVAHVVYTVN